MSARGKFSSRDAMAGWLFMAPSLLLFAALFVYPTIYSFLLSLHSWDGLSEHMTWVGLSNYGKLFHDPIVRICLWNTFLFVVLTVVVQTGLALGLAVLNESLKGRFIKAVLRSTFFFPALISTVVVGLIWGWLYHPHFGAINDILRRVDLLAPGGTILWLQNEKTVMLSIIAASIWQWAGFNMLVFAAGLQAIDKQLYEAAAIDGANRWQVFRLITLPSLSRMTTVVVVTTMINGLKVFDLVYVLTGGGPANRSEVLGTWVYKQAFQYSDMGYASAIGYALAGLTAVLTIIYLRLQRNHAE